DVPRLAADVERILCVALHAVSQLERLNAGFELRIVGPLLLMPLVQLQEQIELCALLCRRHPRITDVLDEAVDARMPRVGIRALAGARQKAGLPVLRLLNRITAGAHGDEAGKVLDLRA